MSKQNPKQPEISKGPTLKKVSGPYFFSESGILKFPISMSKQNPKQPEISKDPTLKKLEDPTFFSKWNPQIAVQRVQTEPETTRNLEGPNSEKVGEPNFFLNFEKSFRTLLFFRK